jgi:hypothetical protein
MNVDNVNINYLDVQLLDDQNEIFNNNNIDWYFILEYN